MIGSPTSSQPDLRRASLANLRTIDLRGADRDFWADEAAIRDRFVASWAGLADEARSGRPRRVDHRAVVAATLKPPPKKYGG